MNEIEHVAGLIPQIRKPTSLENELINKLNRDLQQLVSNPGTFLHQNVRKAVRLTRYTMVLGFVDNFFFFG